MSEIQDQPAPVANTNPPVWEEVIGKLLNWMEPSDLLNQIVTDCHERDRLGRERYGTPLQPFNGRDPLIDAYQEAQDLVAYLAQCAMEEDGRRSGMEADYWFMCWDAVKTLRELRQRINRRADR